MPNLKARSQLVCFNKNQITLNTVIKAESLYQLIYFKYLMLQVNVNRQITSLCILNLKYIHIYTA